MRAPAYPMIAVVPVVNFDEEWRILFGTRNSD